MKNEINVSLTLYGRTIWTAIAPLPDDSARRMEEGELKEIAKRTADIVVEVIQRGVPASPAGPAPEEAAPPKKPSFAKKKRR